ncbi:MAG: hypothetical protein ACRDP1_15215 [Nocardioidaceae bacterium]
MAVQGESRTRHRADEVSDAERWLLRAIVLVVVTLLLIEVVGGQSWQWTGFGQNQHLWDWLHLLLLPVVLALLPVLSRHRPGRPRGWRLAVVATGPALLVLLVILGYAVPWSWTGFTGNTLWDWLDLLLLPVSISLLPFLLETDDAVRTRWLTGFGAFVVVFAVLAVPGYMVPWRWTGVTGNTLWDWVQLLIVPFALPVTVTVVMHETRRP